MGFMALLMSSEFHSIKGTFHFLIMYGIPPFVSGILIAIIFFFKDFATSISYFTPAALCVF